MKYNKETAESVARHGNEILTESLEFLEKVGKSIDDLGNKMDKIDIPSYKAYTPDMKQTTSVSTTVVMRGRWNIFKRLIKGIFTGYVKFTIQKRSK